MVSSTCFEHPHVDPQEDLYMQFYGIPFMHPYKQSGRWQDAHVLPCSWMFETCQRHSIWIETL